MSKIMTRNPIFVTSDSLAIEALQKMVQGDIRLNFSLALSFTFSSCSLCVLVPRHIIYLSKCCNSAELVLGNLGSLFQNLCRGYKKSEMNPFYALILIV